MTTTAPDGGTTVSVTISGGSDAGSYTGSDNPNCSSGLVGDGVWGVQYSTDAAGTGELSSVQLIAPPDASSDVSLTMTVTIGKLFEGNDYEISDTAGGSGSAQVTDNGATAVIHVTGTTADGVGLDVTVTCPSVIRG